MECPVQILSSHPIFPSSLLFFPPQICSAAYFHGLKKWEIRVLLVRGDGYSRIWTDGPDWKGQKSLASPIRFGFHPESLCVCFFLTFIFVRSPRVYFWELWCCSVLFSPPPLQWSRLKKKWSKKVRKSLWVLSGAIGQSLLLFPSQLPRIWLYAVSPPSLYHTFERSIARPNAVWEKQDSCQTRANVFTHVGTRKYCWVFAKLREKTCKFSKSSCCCN